MASQMIWLFSYVSLGLALTLGNRPGVHNQRGQFRSRQYDHRLRTIDRPIGGAATATAIGKKVSTSESDSSYRYKQEPEPYDLPPDWIVYNDENTRDPPDNELEGLRDSVNDNLFDQFTNAVLDTLNPHRNILSNDRRKIVGYDDVDSLSNHLIRQRPPPPPPPPRQHRDNELLSHSIDINDNNALTSVKKHYYDLNDELNDRQNGLTAASLKSTSSLWSTDDMNYPLRLNVNSEIRLPNSGGITTHTRTFGKRNQQMTAGRRRLSDSRSSTSTSASKQQHQQDGGQPPPPPSLVSSISSPGMSVGGVASQFMLRAARGNRQYDVPQIECPPSEDGMERFACPTPDRMGRYRCIDDHVLCNGFFDCPLGEDEDRQSCMFYKTTKAHLDVLAEALLRWVRAR